MPRRSSGRYPFGLQVGELVRADRARVAEQLGDERTFGILAPRLDHDLDAGERVTGLRDQARGRIRDVGRDPDEIEPGSGVAVDRAVDVGRIHLQERGQAGDHVVATLLREVDRADLHRERRHVLHERDALAVVDQAAGRRDRLDRRPVALAQGGELAAVHDLEVEEARREAADRQDRRQREDQEPAAGTAVLLPTVDERVHLGARSSSWTKPIVDRDRERPEERRKDHVVDHAGCHVSAAGR